jgi:hypothetical protein|tara:strand:+ start:66563 stop:67576 length:1014 start_codon:yes stop_codon:yes gene_type:complete
MFSYPYGIIESDAFTRAELIALKPLMISKCIRADHEFEKVFEQTLAHLYKSVEMQSKIIFSNRQFPIEVLNQFPTNWLAQRKNYRMHEILFHQDKVSSFFNTLTNRDNIQNSTTRLNKGMITLHGGVSVAFGRDKFRINISEHRGLFVDFPMSQKTSHDIVKLKRYLTRLIRATYTNNICLVVPIDCAPDTPLKLALPITYLVKGEKTEGYLLEEGQYEQAYRYNKLPLTQRFIQTKQVSIFVQKSMELLDQKQSDVHVPILQNVLEALMTFEPLKPTVGYSPLVHVMSSKYSITGSGLNFVISQRTLEKLENRMSQADMKTFTTQPFNPTQIAVGQ